MTSRLVEMKEKEEGSQYKRFFWTGFKLCLGIVAVSSVFLLQQKLNGMGCRYAVQYTGVAGLSVLAVGKSLLKHRFTGYLLDAVYLLAIGLILFNSVHGMSSLESGGCNEYFEENTDTEIKPTTEFINETEYTEWINQQNQKKSFKHR